MKATFLFPGQGSQVVGMGADIFERSDIARSRFEQANQILGRDIASLCFNGPEEDLKATQNTQPALFVVEAAICDTLRQNGIEPAYAAGHSLGEYSALYAAGAFSFEDGVRMVAQRGALMAAAGVKKPGTMAAIIGMSVEQISEVLSQISDGIVVPANQNTPQQVVISGEIAAVNKACELLKAAGAKRALPLPVSGAFHSPLMQDAADEFGQFLENIQFTKVRCPIISNVTAQPESNPERLKALLLKQLVSPVRWVDSMITLECVDHGSCLEVGPGAVLKGLVQKCSDKLNIISCGTAENIYSLPSQ
jgi:[acyl-carrier-protein] S-malonyltransferase